VLADHVVHLLVAVDLQRDGAKKAGAVLFDRLQFVAALFHALGELHIAALPLLHRNQALLGLKMLIAAVVA